MPSSPVGPVLGSWRRIVVPLVCALAAAACTPTFWLGSTVQATGAGGRDTRITWNPAYDQEYPAPGHAVVAYEVRVDGALVATHGAATASCRLTGLSGGTSYTVEIVAVTGDGERSDTLPPSIGVLRTTVTTPAGPASPGPVDCVLEPDTDGDRLPDAVETDTGTYIDHNHTGTSPTTADTDGDGIDDGDEVVGTRNGLILPLLGADPLRTTVFLEIDWFDDGLDPGTCAAHSHRPTPAMVDRVVQAFAAAPVANPDGSTGIDLIVDHGQGGLFHQGTLIVDPTPPFGSIAGTIGGAEWAALKAANFEPIRAGYFHYAIHMHRYNTSSWSSGFAELPGDDLLVSLYCYESLTNTSNTMMHELGHNLGLRHGGDVNLPNDKPDYNSVMNYRFQFSGVDHDPGEGQTPCDAVGDQELDYSSGTRIVLPETAVVEAAGVCGAPAIDWNGNAVIDPAPYVRDLTGEGSLTTLTDHDDWRAITFGGIGGGAGARLAAPEVVAEMPVPVEFRVVED